MRGVAIQSISSVAALTTNLYEHPFAVTEIVNGAQRHARRTTRGPRCGLSDNAAGRDRFGAEVDAQL